MKPLLVIFKPRDIPEFEEATNKLKIDKLWMKYHPQDPAYKTARDYFLATDYTHFIILPDDLIVTQRDLDMLLSEPEEMDSISGWCNNTALKSQGVVSPDTPDVDTDISRWSPPPVPQKGKYKEYNWMTIEEITKRRDSGEHIITVLHQGFALSRLSRKLINAVPFRTADGGCCVDTCMSLDLMRARIPQYVNVHIEMKHLYIPSDRIQVGKKEPDTVLEVL